MFITSFKVSGYKVFGPLVELSMVPRTKNYRKLAENLHVIGKRRVLKSALIYGGNNTGKSSLVSALRDFKKIIFEGSIELFNFDLFKNFCYEEDDIRFEITFLDNLKEYTYGIEFSNKDALGEYLYENDNLLYSRDKNGDLEGSFIQDNDKLRERISDLPRNKVILTYVNEYMTDPGTTVFSKVKSLFQKIVLVDEKKKNTTYQIEVYKFAGDNEKMKLLNKLLSDSNLYVEKRELLDEEQALKVVSLFQDIDTQTLDQIKGDKNVLDILRMTSYYKDRKGNLIPKPSVLFDSRGTVAFINLCIHIINAMLEGKILFIDELDSSLHYRLTRALAILVNSEANHESQFIMTTHDVKLLTPFIFRKDQINFIIRNQDKVEIVSLDDFKANSHNDVRSDTNFEKLYTEERVVDLPYSDLTNMIEELNSLWEEKQN